MSQKFYINEVLQILSPTNSLSHKIKEFFYADGQLNQRDWQQIISVYKNKNLYVSNYQRNQVKLRKVSEQEVHIPTMIVDRKEENFEDKSPMKKLQVSSEEKNQ